MSKKVYIVYDETSEKRAVFEDYERAKEANSVGHWSRRALYPAVLNPDDVEGLE